MKRATRILGCLMVMSFAASAFATSERKPVTRIDFNKMIDENNSKRADLQKGIETQAAEASADADKAKVVDFVDVEVGWGEAPPVVDRRFDSVGGSRKYRMNDEDFSSSESGT